MNGHLSTYETDRLEEGILLGPFEVCMWIRDGGMASLYLGEHTQTEEQVAIKVISPHCAELPVTRARFDREIKLMKQLQDVPEVAHYQGAGLLPDGRPYVVMEWIEGNDLDDHLEQHRDRGQRLHFAETLRIVRDVARALEALHARGIVHRDVKPGNIMIARWGEGPLARLVDFGVAADLQRGEAEGLTVGIAPGTEPYSSPEQRQGRSPRPSADVWALGIVMLEALAGPRPSPELHTEGLVSLPDLEAPSDLVPRLAKILRSCITFDEAARPTAGALRRELDEVLAELESESAPLLAEGERPSAQAGELVSAKSTRVAPGRTAVATGRTVVATGRTIGGDVPLRVVGSSVAVTQRVEAEAPIPAALMRGGTVPNRRDTLLAAAATATATAAEPEEEADDGVRDSKRILYTVLGVAAIALLGVGVWRRAPTTDEERIARADDAVSKSAAMVMSSPAREAPELSMGAGTEHVIEAHPVPPPTPLEDDPPPTPPHKLELVRPGTPMETAKPPVDIKINTKRKPRSASPPRKRLSPDSSECQTQRQKAEQAARDRSWSVVLTETLRSECWPSSTGRKVMRLEALMELGRYEQCVIEGAGISSPLLKTRVDACRTASNQK